MASALGGGRLVTGFLLSGMVGKTGVTVVLLVRVPGVTVP